MDVFIGCQLVYEEIQSSCTTINGENCETANVHDSTPAAFDSTLDALYATETDHHASIPSNPSMESASTSNCGPKEASEIEIADSDATDETRVDLEIIENHMRHANSNAGPFYEKDMPIVLGRDIFKKFDKHRFRGRISRAHCQIECVREGDVVEYYVKDVSVNGTFIGPNRIRADGPGALLQHGDVIGLLTSHSSPIETYSAEGEIFKVTLGVRWLRPNQNDENPAIFNVHTHIHTAIAERNRYGVFVGVEGDTDDVTLPNPENELSAQKLTRSGVHSIHSGCSTPKHNTTTKDSRRTSSKQRTTSRLSLQSDLSRRTSASHNDDDSTTSERSYSSSRSFSTNTKSKTTSIGTHHAQHRSTRISQSSSPSITRSSTPTPMTAPGSHWLITPGSRSRKRGHQEEEYGSDTELSFNGPRLKVSKVE